MDGFLYSVSDFAFYTNSDGVTLRAYEWEALKSVELAAAAIAQSGSSDPTDPVVFIGGFLDKTLDQLLSEYMRDLQQKYQDLIMQYFTWDEKDEAEAYIESLGVDASITVVGHSYGGDTAAEIAKDLPGMIDVLITIDPVGRGVNSDFLSAVAQNVGVWIDVNAVGGGPLQPSNAIAWMGGDYGSAPSSYTTYYIESPYPHDDFYHLMTDMCAHYASVAGGAC